MTSSAGPTVSDRLRAAILSAGVSRYRIAQATGVEQSALSRFVRGQAGLDLSSVDKLAGYLGLDLVYATDVGPKAPNPKER